ncbi:hypothetical protein C0992_003292, partial [Termitomyces sp. T32_za158]
MTIGDDRAGVGVERAIGESAGSEDAAGVGTGVGSSQSAGSGKSEVESGTQAIGGGGGADRVGGFGVDEAFALEGAGAATAGAALPDCCLC